jgi:hypothetical protein
MKFNEWITQNKEEEFSGLKTTRNLGLETQEDKDLIESQLDQWATRLMGLLQTIPQDRKQKLLEKVIGNIKALSS